MQPQKLPAPAANQPRFDFIESNLRSGLRAKGIPRRLRVQRRDLRGGQRSPQKGRVTMKMMDLVPINTTVSMNARPLQCAPLNSSAFFECRRVVNCTIVLASNNFSGSGNLASSRRIGQSAGRRKTHKTTSSAKKTGGPLLLFVCVVCCRSFPQPIYLRCGDGHFLRSHRSDWPDDRSHVA
jgi:hypothetical protein